MKKTIRMFALIASVVMLFASCIAQAETKNTQILNILFLACEGEGETYYPNAPAILTLDFSKQTIRITKFFSQAQIFAETRQLGELSMPMNFLLYCNTDKIVTAYENTFGISIEKYIIFRYQYYTYKPILEGLDILCPVKLDIPDEVLGDQQYTTTNGNMAALAQTTNREYNPITATGVQDLDAMGIVGYVGATPERIWESGDKFTMMLEDYRYRDAIIQEILEALDPVISKLDRNQVEMLWRLLLAGQETNITLDDIDAWSQISFHFPTDNDAYLTVPVSKA